MSEMEFESPTGSAFPRPTSLFQPERFSPSLLDSSSYSPFPTVSGSRADPFGLNAYLLHPGDQIWAYIAPASSELSYDGEQLEKGVVDSAPKSRMGGLKKMKSSQTLRKGSPLSQPSMVSVPASIPVPERSLERRRSQSMDSSALLSAMARDESIASQKTGSVGKKGFGRLFGRRKSVSSTPVVEDVLPPVPTIPAAFTPSSSSSDLSTPPPSNRSSMLISDHSSIASSSSSIYGPQTPRDSPAQSTDSLTEALAKVEQGEEVGLKQRKGLMGWLGRRSSKMPISGPSSAPTSPAISPNPSLTDLTQPPTPVIADPPSRISPSAEQQPYAWVGDQMRRASYRKLSQLRRPSPHPLAQQLRRQTSHLPNEVASSFEVGQVVYPRSINPRDPLAGLTPAQRGLWCLLGVKLILDRLDTGALPSGAMTKRPNLPHTPSDRKPRGMRDFINRPPFEDRHYVYYPEDSWSPVSMARPGFGVWDLDFSKYILALADSGDVDGAPWPNLPRPSFLAVDGLRPEGETGGLERAVVEISEDGEMFGGPLVPISTHTGNKPASIESTLSDDSSNTTTSTAINTPPVLDAGQLIPQIKIDFDETELAASKGDEHDGEDEEVTVSRSSFRRPVSRMIQTWDDSDDEDDEEEEEEEDVEPLKTSQIGRFTPTSDPIQSGMKVSSSAPNVRDAIKSHSRRISQPIIPTSSIQQIPTSSTNRMSKRRSQFDMALPDDERQRRAMDEVAKARERRQALHSGEVDRKAEGESRRKEEAKRRSVISPAVTAPLRPQSTGGASGKRSSVQLPSTERQRTKSFAHTTNGTPVDQPRTSIGQTKRYHSFYELPSVPTSSSSCSPSNQQYSGFPIHHPGMAHSTSMGYPPSHTMMGTPQNMAYYPQPIPQMFYPSPMQFGYNPTMSPQMTVGGGYAMARSPIAGMPNSRSSLNISEQQRNKLKQRTSYA